MILTIAGQDGSCTTLRPLSALWKTIRRSRLAGGWRGYQSFRSLTTADIAEMDSFILMRRMALLAWAGTHAHTKQASDVAPHFATGSAGLAEAYLTQMNAG